VPYCPNCGKEAAVGAEFCQNCGARLNQAVTVRIPTSEPFAKYSGRAITLVILWVFGLGALILSYTWYFVSSDANVAYVAWGILIVVTFASTEIIYEDAKKVNQAKGRKVVDATLWSLVTFLLWEVASPWYVFSRRKAALTSP
jgi:uncharacterized membrane protein